LLIRVALKLAFTWRVDRGKTVTKLFALGCLGLLMSEKQIPQVVENLESGNRSKEPLERTELLRRRRVPSSKQAAQIKHFKSSLK
jgi:hypothetical protein